MMKTNTRKFYIYLPILLCMFLALGVCDDLRAAGSVFKQEELEQIVAPVALYPDSLLSQILMASTYPFEVVQAQRWVEQNKSITGDALAIALEKQSWDPSVKSLVNFPQVLTMMNEKLGWTQKLGDAFLAQQKDVMHAVQKLREKAIEQGNLESTEQQAVSTENGQIVIEWTDPETAYIPVYDPVEIYGDWPYSDYPPYYYYPPGYVYVDDDPLLGFGAGVIIGAGWGYAWGDCDWHDGCVDIDIDRNFDLNHRIDRGKYVEHYQKNGRLDQNGKGIWQHNPENRKGVAYRDPETAQKYNRASAADAVKSREEYRGRAEQGRQDIARGDADRYKGTSGDNLNRNLQPATPARPRDVSGGVSNRGGALDGIDRSSPARVPSTRPAPRQSGTVGGVNRSTVPASYNRPPSSNRGGAFDSMDRGSSTRNYSSRGSSSLQSVPRSSGARPSGGGSRGGGGRR
jgi:hypothetical protein